MLLSSLVLLVSLLKVSLRIRFACCRLAIPMSLIFRVMLFAGFTPSKVSCKFSTSFTMNSIFCSKIHKLIDNYGMKFPNLEHTSAGSLPIVFLKCTVNGTFPYSSGGTHSGWYITTANQLRHNWVEFSQFSILVTNRRTWTFIECYQHECGRNSQLKQL